MTSSSRGMARGHASSPPPAAAGAPPARGASRRPGGVGVARGDRVAARGAEPRAQRRVVRAGGAARPASAAASPAGTTRPVSLVADEPAGGGADRGGGDHGHSLVEGFVDHQPPRLEEVARGDRRYDDDVRARVEVAHFRGRQRRRGRSRRRRRPGLGAGRRRPGPARPPVLVDSSARQARSSTASALLPLQPAGKHHLERRLRGAASAGRGPERVVDALRRLEHRPARALARARRRDTCGP